MNPSEPQQGLLAVLLAQLRSVHSCADVEANRWLMSFMATPQSVPLSFHALLQLYHVNQWLLTRSNEAHTISLTHLSNSDKCTASIIPDMAVPPANADEWTVEFVEFAQTFAVTTVHARTKQDVTAWSEEQVKECYDKVWYLFLCYCHLYQSITTVSSSGSNQDEGKPKDAASFAHVQLTSLLIKKLAQLLALLALERSSTLPLILDSLSQQITLNLPTAPHAVPVLSTQQFYLLPLYQLTVLESIADHRHLSATGQRLKHSQTAQYLPHVCQHVHNALSASLPLHQLSIQSLDHAQLVLVQAALKCLCSWCNIGLSLTHMYSSQVHKALNVLFECVFQRIATDAPATTNKSVTSRESHETMLQSGCQRVSLLWLELMESAVESEEEDTVLLQQASSPLLHVMCLILDSLLQHPSLKPHLYDNVMDSRNINEFYPTLARHVASLFGALVVASMDGLQKGSRDTLAVATLLPKLCSSRITSRPVLPALLALSDVPVQYRHTIFDEKWWERLVEALIHGLKLPYSFQDWLQSHVEGEDEQEFERRRMEFAEVLEIASCLLSASFLETCFHLMELSQQQQSWQLMEASFYCATKFAWQEQRTQFEPERIADAVQRIIEVALSIPPSRTPHILLLTSMCNFIDRLCSYPPFAQSASRYQSQLQPHRLETLQWLMQSCALQPPVITAGPALHQFLSMYARQLAADKAISSWLKQQITASWMVIASSWKPSARVYYIKGLIAFIQVLPLTEIQPCLKMLWHSVIGWLKRQDLNDTSAWSNPANFESFTDHMDYACALLAALVADNSRNVDVENIWHQVSLEVLITEWGTLHRILELWNYEPHLLINARAFFDAFFVRLEQVEAGSMHRFAQELVTETLAAAIRSPSPVLMIELRSLVNALPRVCDAIFHERLNNLIKSSLNVISAPSSTHLRLLGSRTHTEWIESFSDHLLHLCNTPVAEWLNNALDYQTTTNLMNVLLCVCAAGEGHLGVEHALMCLSALLLALETNRAEKQTNPQKAQKASCTPCEEVIRASAASCVRVLMPLCFPDFAISFDSPLVRVASETRALLHQLLSMFSAECAAVAVEQIVSQCTQHQWSLNDAMSVAELSRVSSERGADMWRHFLFTLHRALPDKKITPSLLAFRERGFNRMQQQDTEEIFLC